MHTTPHTPETIAKMRKSSKRNPKVFKQGQHASPATEFKKGMVAPNRGKVLSEETKKRISQSKKGQTPWNKGKTGFHHTEETKRKISESTKGEGGNNWQGGITPANRLGRTGREYQAWQSAVFHKDNFTCQICDQYNGYLHADHIKPYAHHPELRYDVDNGRTLCRACHYYITFKRKMPSTSKWGLKQGKRG